MFSFAALVLMLNVREWWSSQAFLLVKALDTLDLERLAPANWLMTTGATFPSFLFWITFLLELFSALPQKGKQITKTGPTGKRERERAELRTASLSLRQTGLAATWCVTSTAQHPTDCQQVPWQRRNPRAGYCKAPTPNVRTAGLC